MNTSADSKTCLNSSIDRSPRVEPINPLQVKIKDKFYHPYAQQQNLTEKLQELVHDCVESVWFFAYDVVCYVFDKLWQFLVMILCVPIAVLGLIFDKLRLWVKMVS